MRQKKVKKVVLKEMNIWNKYIITLSDDITSIHIRKSCDSLTAVSSSSNCPSCDVDLEIHGRNPFELDTINYLDNDSYFNWKESSSYTLHSKELEGENYVTVIISRQTSAGIQEHTYSGITLDSAKELEEAWL